MREDDHQIECLGLRFKWQCTHEFSQWNHHHHFFFACRMDQQRVPMFIPRVALVNSSSNSSNQSSSQYRHRSRKADWSEESGESDGFYAEKNKVAGSKSRANRKKEIYYVHKGPKRSKAGSTHTTESSSTSSLSSSNRSSHVSIQKFLKLNLIELDTQCAESDGRIRRIFIVRASTRCC